MCVDVVAVINHEKYTIFAVRDTFNTSVIHPNGFSILVITPLILRNYLIALTKISMIR